MNTLRKILKISWLQTFYFNFHYLPLKQAIKLPVFLYHPKLLKCKGQVIIESENIRRGMIRFGEYIVSLYPNTGIVWENHGGKVIFKGNCTVVNSSAISIGEKGTCVIGNNFRANASLKLTSHHQITFGENTLIAWDLIIMDTSFHRLKDLNGHFKNKGYAPVVIGKNNWITTKCIILSGTKTPDYCTIGAGSVLNRDYSGFPTHIVIAGNPVEIKVKNVWIDLDDHDIIDYVI